MSDPKRATFITVDNTKSEKTKVNKTVRLTINLDESNESKYSELNYKELVKAEERKKKVQNGKTEAGLNPYSDNDEDVERVAKKFEQKYGGKSTYGRKGRSKHDDFADIGAGYDENDSFIDNTDGYDEMIPPECDTLYGGFYINSGSLEFKNVQNHREELSDAELGAGRRNKRRISSSSSEDESSESSSESESQEEKDPKVITNGDVVLHKTEHRKKKIKNNDKQKAKKIRRTDSSAATSGKQTSDDNGHGDAESDSRTSQSDSLTSKPAPSSENAITSDSSRDVESKDVIMPAPVAQILEELEAAVTRQLMDNPNTTAKEMETKTDVYIVRLETSLYECGSAQTRRGAWGRAARCLHVSRVKLLQRARALCGAHTASHSPDTPPTTANNAQVTNTATTTTSNTSTPNNKRKCEDDLEDLNIGSMSDEQREVKIVDTLQRLKALIDERKPGMMANYNAECERVQEERKKIQIASADGAPHIEKRLPKRRFPWCARTRSLLARLRVLAGNGQAAAVLLADRALPLFPNGFVRMPTLLRQADLSKEIKVNEIKRQRLGSQSQLTPQATQSMQFMEPIQFPSSLTVTTMKTSPDKTEVIEYHEKESKYNSTSVFGNIINTFSLSKDLVVEAQDDRRKESVIVIDKGKEDLYIPPNNIGSITITPVPNNQPKVEKKVNNVIITETKHKEALIRVKSPAALNEMVKKENQKALEIIQKIDVIKKDKDKHKICDIIQPNSKEKTVHSPLHIDTSYQNKLKEPTASPKSKIEEISRQQIESMRVAENNIPRPALIPAHLSPTFAKPDKRPPEQKKKKDLVIVSDVDPLSDVQQEPVAIDDSSSDVELVEDNKSEKPSVKSDSVPSKDKVIVLESSNLKDSARHSKDVPEVRMDGEKKSDKLDEATKEDFDSLMKNLRDMEHSQEPKFSSNSYGGVITSAKREKSSSQSSFSSRSNVFQDTRSDKDKFTERTSLNKMDGCSAVTANEVPSEEDPSKELETLGLPPLSLPQL